MKTSNAELLFRTSTEAYDPPETNHLTRPFDSSPVDPSSKSTLELHDNDGDEIRELQDGKQQLETNNEMSSEEANSHSTEQRLRASLGGRERRTSNAELISRFNTEADDLLEIYHLKRPSGLSPTDFLLKSIPALCGKYEDIRKLRDDKQQSEAENRMLAKRESYYYHMAKDSQGREKSAVEQLESLGHERDAEVSRLNRELVSTNQAKEAMETSLVEKANWANEQHAMEVRELKRSHEETLRRLRRSHAIETSKLQNKHADEMARLEKTLDDAEAQLAGEVSKLKKKHADEMVRVKEMFDDEVEGLAKAHEKQKAQITADATAQLASTEKAAEHMLDMVRSQKDSEIAARGKEIERLMLRMASYNTNSYRAIPDNDFVASFGQLSQRIINLSSNTAFRDGTGIDKAALDLDPADFLGRRGYRGRNWVRLVRNVCWKLLLHGFFSQPLGFGAFGALDDQDEGYAMVQAEYALFTAGGK